MKNAQTQLRRVTLTLVSVLVSLNLCALAWGQRPRPTRRKPMASKTATTSLGQQEIRYKGIFEPISYPQDLEFTDVFFVTRDIGWVVGGNARGGGGVVLYTTDGGDHWTLNMGDPQSNVSAYQYLRFIDQRHGWMWQGKQQLLRTVDGQNWEVVANFNGDFFDYAFTSPTNGVMASSDKILRTTDAGKTWAPVSTCRISLQINGLTQDTDCTFQSLHFPSPQVGYVVAYHGSSAILVKTTDGGASWSLSVALPEEGGKEGEIFFLDENNGFLRIANGNLYASGDGAQSWHQLPGVYIGGRPEMKFADPEVGWSVVYHTLAFTTDGHRWTSRDIAFPSAVNAFSLPTRERGYVVGSHGMIYRYRVVPASYTAKGMIDAPLMPGNPLDADARKMQTQLELLQNKLRAKFPAVQFADNGTANPTSSAPPPSSDAGGNSGVFQQSTSASATGTESSNFQQATSGGGLVDSCCMDLVQGLGSSVDTFSTDVPRLGGGLRSLNLVLVGLQFVSNLTNHAQGLKNALRNLRQARDPQALSTTFNALASQVNVVHQSTSAGFQQDVGGFQQQSVFSQQ